MCLRLQIVVLMQLDKLGIDHVVPVLIMNYDGFYARLLEFLDEAVEYGELLPGSEVMLLVMRAAMTNNMYVPPCGHVVLR